MPSNATYLPGGLAVPAGKLYESTGPGGTETAIPRVKGGTLSVASGSGTVLAAAHGLTTITSVVACLGTDANIDANDVTATWSGTTVTIKVWKPTSVSNPTPIAATVTKAVNYIITGS